MATITIYRMVEATDTAFTNLQGISDTQRVDFDFVPTTDNTTAHPDTLSSVVSFSADIGRHNAENPLPHTNVVDKPDTGFAGDMYAFNLIFRTELSRPAGLTRLISWMLEPQVIDGKYDEGRIGITNPWLPELDLKPGGTAGYKMTMLRPNIDMQYPEYIPATLTLEFSGDPDELGTRLSYT